MKVLQVVPTLSAGGAETLVAELALALGRRGHEVGVALLAGARGPRGAELADRLEASGIAVSGRALHSMRRPDGAVSLMRVVRAFRPEVMHSHLYAADFILAGVNALTVRQRLIRTIHNTAIQGTRSRAGTWLLDRLFATSVACGERVAEAYASYFGDVRKSAVVTVRNGVARMDRTGTQRDDAALRASLGIAADAFLYVHVGAFRGQTLASSQKAHDVLLEAFAQLRAHPAAARAKLLLIGDGELRVAAQQLARLLRIDDRVTFAGVLENVPRYLDASDAFVFPSRYEGLPVALIEACLTGIPVIATALPEIAEVFGTATYASAPVGNAAGFAAAMLDCLLAPEPAQARAAQAAAHVAREFSIDLCAARYEAQYGALIGRPDVTAAPQAPASAPLTVSKRSHQETT
ncbi:glycosyltransferase [Paraburkholderia ferrariae]|uniref:glycosyltransferase n=1 Tax=Paraburkholderia ferrariae TaxID=386056 RepID=UPI000483EAED|nr:glycosyltransferase [Paraburkholderia ferrariae]